MVTNKEDLLSLLAAENFMYKLYEHPAVYTVEEGMQHCHHIPGAHIKNLFLRNKKKTSYWLVSVAETKRVDLKQLGDLLAGGRLSFVNNESLVDMLGVQPGSVTPLAIINDKEQQVQLFLDRDLLTTEYINIHPMENTATIHLKLQDLLNFIENYTQIKVKFIDVPRTAE